MKVIFEKEKLQAALIPAAAIAPNRNTNYILECVLLDCNTDEDNICRITAYDMEKGLRTEIECTILEKGCFALNSQNILQIVRSMPDGEILFEVDDRNRAKISNGNASFEIGAAPGENYPSLPLLSGDKNYKLPQYIMRSLINKTLFATSQSDQGKSFSGVLIKVEGGKITAVGCDRNMLAVAEYESDAEVEEHKIIIPGRILSEIIKSVKDSEDEMEISVARKHVIFRIDKYVYFSRLIEDEYFNYGKILSFPCDSYVYVNCAALRDAVERASIVTEDKLGGKTKNSLVVNYKKDSLEISSNSANGSVYDEISASTENIEEDITFKYNCRYILNVLKACDETETIKISLSGPTMGMKITNGDSDSKEKVDYTFYVMPMSNVR
ncbi:MAG: DNA polymerase III subunit beta [Clostridia bacterium]|nr:DNA polymerase III subunit beta [Clostridia bacterium]